MFFFVLGTFTTAAFFLIVTWKIYEFFNNVRASRKEKIHKIINKVYFILDNLGRTRHQRQITISKLRENVLSHPSQIEDWEIAISFLENNDHRLSFGIENIDGLDMKIIRINN